MSYIDRVYDVYAILGDPNEPPSWTTAGWARILPYLDSLVNAARGKAVVRSHQYVIGGGSPSKSEIRFGRIGWNDTGHKKWLHQSANNKKIRFHNTEVVAPSLAICEREQCVPPICFSRFKTSNILPKIMSILTRCCSLPLRLTTHKSSVPLVKQRPKASRTRLRQSCACDVNAIGVTRWTIQSVKTISRGTLPFAPAQYTIGRYRSRCSSGNGSGSGKAERSLTAATETHDYSPTPKPNPRAPRGGRRVRGLCRSLKVASPLVASSLVGAGQRRPPDFFDQVRHRQLAFGPAVELVVGLREEFRGRGPLSI